MRLRCCVYTHSTRVGKLSLDNGPTSTTAVILFMQSVMFSMCDQLKMRSLVVQDFLTGVAFTIVQ